MDQERYRQRLLDQERQLLDRIERARTGAREAGDDGARDAGDESVLDAAKDAQFATADTQLGVLNQVREALQRIENGTFGACTVDGGPIEPARLDAVPWTPYCLKHQEQLGEGGGVRTSTL